MSNAAPADYSLTEGVGTISDNAILKHALHPQTAQLWVRWVASEEGQQAYATAGATPAHPGVEPVLKTRPERIYPFGMAEIAEQQRYERAWREIFQLR